MFLELDSTTLMFSTFTKSGFSFTLQLKKVHSIVNNIKKRFISFFKNYCIFTF
ncbi:hypothetical protein JCM19302_183 [Jejuia pallidilutea]|uniref:Uncharacterized protein n=1 Tax=Jejuia pallidilutea TaxID=504487 RepID=A0A090W9E1_9FLAO|nr:hypothetical protein JCM19302_183 [Jejuia pallidilutea]